MFDQLGHTTPEIAAVSPPKTARNPPRLLHTRLHHLENSLKSVNKAIKPLAPRPNLDNCLIRQLDKQIGCFQADLSDSLVASCHDTGKTRACSKKELALDKTPLTGAYESRDCSVTSPDVN